MRGRRFVTADVFTDQPFGGNPLAVLPEADGLDPEAMQRIAREFNLSETAFVFRAPDAAHDALVRIFTPRTELPFAGHPNVGTAFLLARLGKAGPGRHGADTLRFLQAAGTVEARLLRDAAGAVTGAAIDAPRPFRRGATLAPADAAASVALDPAEIRTGGGRGPCLASVGMDMAFAEVSAEALGRAAPREAAIEALGVRTIYLYARTAPGAVTARLFAPAEGIPEDPATGSAAATLAALLLSVEGGEALSLAVSQGASVGRPSRMEARAVRRGGDIRAAVGGGCVMMSEGRLFL